MTAIIETLSFLDLQQQGLAAMFKQRCPVVVDLGVERLLTTHPQDLDAVFKDHSLTILKRPLEWTNAYVHGNEQQATIHDFFTNPIYQQKNTTHDYILITSLMGRVKQLQQLVSSDLLTMIQSELTEVRLWSSFAESLTGVHFDNEENLNLQLSGQKRFVFYPPGIRHYYTRSLFSGVGHTSKVNDIESANLSQYPKLLKAQQKKLEVTLNPGQMVYIPTGWWHQVENSQGATTNLLFSLPAYQLWQQPYVWVDTAYKRLLKKFKIKKSG